MSLLSLLIGKEGAYNLSCIFFVVFMIGAVFNLLTLFWDILTDLNKDLVHLC